MERTAHKREDAGARSADLKAVVATAHAALKAQAAKINALNVYPVPDGDTGTNMLLTLQAVLEEVSASPHLEAAAAAKGVSRAALMGARGNSGVILSQILRGACEVLGQARVLDAQTFAAAQFCVERGEQDLLEVLRVTTLEARASVRRTPELLDILKEAWVVDAGGLGVAVLLDGIRAALSGEELRLDPEEAELTADWKRLRETIEHSAEEAWGYCTEFIVSSFSGAEKEFGAHIHEIGRSVLVIPDGDLVKVHLHTQDPGEALTYAGGFGRLSGVKVDDIEAQTRARTEGEDLSASSPPETAANLGVVVASRGAGNRELFESMGAVVVEGGQGANPSTEDFVKAVRSTGASVVILLPNNKNIVPTAERVQELVEAEVYVVPTTNVAGGLAAMVGYDPEGEPEEVVEEMREIWECLRCADVTAAVRDARVEGREVPKGAYMGLLDGRLFAVEASVRAAALALAGTIVEEGAEVVTLL